MSKKLTLDKSTLARLQAEQLTAVTGGDGCVSLIVTIDVDPVLKGEGDDDAASGRPEIPFDSCCKKSC